MNQTNISQTNLNQIEIIVDQKLAPVENRLKSVEDLINHLIKSKKEK